MILGIRELHQMMGLKKIYRLLSPDWIGRDRFIEIGMENGLGIKAFKNYHRTTFSTKSAWFYNLTVGLAINGINQVCVSDITYYRIGEIFYYITFIEDVYSRRIIGYAVSANLRAEANCKALKMALKTRLGLDLTGLIHHSDRGSQYASNEYIKLLSSHGIAISMCNSVYENTHIERLNGIIKHEYLNNMQIRTISELKKMLDKAVKLYNEERPHWSLGLKTPIEYERILEEIPKSERKILMLYSDKTSSYVQESIFN
jgi:transposase InsO family protein